jgi:hypothetical protein
MAAANPLYNKDEDFIFASPTLNGKQPLWGQTMNADFVKPAVLALGLVTKSERFGWHRFRHSLSTWANEMTKEVAGQAGNSNQRHRATLSKKSLVFSRKIEESGFCISL